MINNDSLVRNTHFQDFPVVSARFFFCCERLHNDVYFSPRFDGNYFLLFLLLYRLDCWLTSLGDNPFYLKECLGLKNPDSGDKLISLHCVPVVTHLGIPLGTQSCTNMSK